MNFDDIIGKTVDSVTLDDASDRITFKFQDGYERSYGVEGDCCSRSWIEHLEVPADVQGASILSVEDSSGAEPYDGHTCEASEYDYVARKVIKEGCGHDVLAVYNTHFHTNRGDVILEYRNDSNGYYGGYLTD